MEIIILTTVVLTVVLYQLVQVVRIRKSGASLRDAKLDMIRIDLVRYLREEPLGKDDVHLMTVKRLLRDLPGIDKEVERLKSKIGFVYPGDSGMEDLKAVWRHNLRTKLAWPRAVHSQCQEVFERMGPGSSL